MIRVLCSSKFCSDSNSVSGFHSEKHECQ